jgi:hypothetical protein
VPAFVCIDPNNVVFQESATQLLLDVDCQPETEEESSTWLVDVGFGEPAIHPLGTILLMRSRELRKVCEASSLGRMMTCICIGFDHPASGFLV